MDLNTYLNDEELYEQIELDCMRTMPQVEFFHSPTDIQIKPRYYTQQYKQRKENKELATKQYDVLARILYIYAKLNPAIKYLQGMNDILAPLMYVIRSEAEVFFCFTILMSQIKDIFIKTLEYTPDGIRGLMLKLDKLFKESEPELYSYLSRLQIHPQFYSYRWIKLCLLQEFTLEQILIIWDQMLSHKNIPQYVTYLCIGVLKYLKPQLLVADFAQAMKLLQNADKDVNQIILIANSLSS